MKRSVYFYTYPSAFQNPGGGEMLLMATKHALEKEGVEVRLFNIWNDRFQKGDLLHVFGSVKEALGLMETAKSKGVTIVHSPIIWYNWQSAIGIPYPWRERVLCFFRQSVKTLLPSWPSARRRMMRIADLVLAGSEMEARQIIRYFSIAPNKVHSVPYGVDQGGYVGPEHFERQYGLKDFVLTVGRIEPRKNQLNLIRAVRGSGRKLVIIGDLVSHHRKYFEQCKRQSDDSVVFLGPLPMNAPELRSAYAACSVFVLPTWFETPGLAAMEAALAGARVVITREGSTREYFKDKAHYVNPGSVYDIRKQIDRAANSPKTEALKHDMEQNFSWTQSARGLIRAYDKVLERNHQ